MSGQQRGLTAPTCQSERPSYVLMYVNHTSPAHLGDVGEQVRAFGGTWDIRKKVLGMENHSVSHTEKVRQMEQACRK